jgi:ABC-type transporter Mla MlaB component
MLKITITENPTEQRWVLEGRLTRPWVAVLRLQWRKTRRARQGRTCVVDLNDVTGIDQHGERVLRTMLREGARCLARGVFTTYLLALIAPQPPEGQE